MGVKGDAVHDLGDEAWVREHGSPLTEWQIRCDRNRRPFFAFGNDLEEKLGAAGVDFDVAKLIEAKQIQAPVAADDAG